MNVIQKALLRLAGVKAYPGETYSLTDAALGKALGDTASSAGVTVNTSTAEKLSAWWCCVRILSETIASLPRAIYRDLGNGVLEKAVDHPLHDIVSSAPNPNMTSVEFFEQQLYWLCADGNAYSYRDNRPDGTPITLTPLESCNVNPQQNKDTGLTDFRVLDRGKWETLPREKIWHIMGFGRNGLIGLSPLGAARDALGAAKAQEDFGAKFFANGGVPAGTVTIEKFLNQDQREIARNNLQQLLGGLGNAHRWALMEGGMKPEPFKAMPLEDMQFLVSRVHSIREICRFYRIPPHMVADLERATFSNIEHMSQEFVTFTLMPYFTRIEAALKRWLLPRSERDNLYLRFNYEGLLRADSAGRAAFYSQGLQNGWISRNEVRAKENLNRSDDEGMDDYTVQVNMTTIGKLGEQQQAQQNYPTPNQDDEPSPTKASEPTTNNFNLVMPETMRQELSQRVELTGMESVAEALKENTEAVTNSLKLVAIGMKKTVDQSENNTLAVVTQLRNVVTRIEKNMAETRELLTADREVYEDENGVAKGTRLVQRKKLGA
jgi:HK97 family phage portal protein